MTISQLLTDDAILAELGRHLAARRLDLQMTQAQVAEQAGIAKRTLERMEAGHSAQMASVVRVLRVLDALPGLDTLIPASGPRPMDQLRRQGKARKRAPGKRGKTPSPGPWTWADDP